MVGLESTQTRMVGKIIIDKMHPYTAFSINRVSTKNCVGMLLSLPFLFVYFVILTSLLSLAIFLVVFFILVWVIF